MIRRISAVVLIGLVCLSGSCTYLSGLFGDGDKPDFGSIPSRLPGARSGSEFMRHISRMSIAQREQAILSEALNGNVPKFMRQLKTIDVSGTVQGKKVKALIFVMPDYFSIGSATNFVRVPMNPITAQRIADRYGFLLPTTKIVDAIYREADVKLSPKPLPPGPQMTSNSYFDRHNKLIQSSLGYSRLGELVAGHKKDVVLTNRLVRQPTKVAIYGWHRPSGRPIQPLSLVHGIRYVDYSHGIRLISKTMYIDGKYHSTAKILQDPIWAGLLSNEGRLTYTKIPLGPISQGPRGPSADIPMTL